MIAPPTLSFKLTGSGTWGHSLLKWLAGSRVASFYWMLMWVLGPLNLEG